MNTILKYPKTNNTTILKHTKQYSNITNIKTIIQYWQQHTKTH